MKTKASELTAGTKRRVMYVESKNGDIDGAGGRIGWVTFSQAGTTVYYRGRTLKRSSGEGILGSYFDEATDWEYWISAVKTKGSNAHWAASVRVRIDPDAREEYRRLRALPDTGKR